MTLAVRGIFHTDRDPSCSSTFDGSTETPCIFKASKAKHSKARFDVSAFSASEAQVVTPMVVVAPANCSRGPNHANHASNHFLRSSICPTVPSQKGWARDPQKFHQLYHLASTCMIRVASLGNFASANQQTSCVPSSCAPSTGRWTFRCLC